MVPMVYFRFGLRKATLCKWPVGSARINVILLLSHSQQLYTSLPPPPPSGVYSPDDYAVAVPHAIITLPTTGLSTLTGLFTVLPPELQQAIRGYVR